MGGGVAAALALLLLGTPLPRLWAADGPAIGTLDARRALSAWPGLPATQQALKAAKEAADKEFNDARNAAAKEQARLKAEIRKLPSGQSVARTVLQEKHDGIAQQLKALEARLNRELAQRQQAADAEARSALRAACGVVLAAEGLAALVDAELCWAGGRDVTAQVVEALKKAK
ncbi:MAG TPA: OmpH family outer membrane protein [Armatimonadota bacterium]